MVIERPSTHETPTYSRAANSPGDDLVDAR